jgi:hypothetical protein
MTLTIVALAAAGGVRADVLASSATFNDTRTTSAAQVGSGTVRVAVDGGEQSGSWTGGVSLVPGESTYAGIRVLNAGTVRLRYAVTARSSSALAARLMTSVAVLPPGTTTCTADTFTTGTAASELDQPFGSSPALELIGSPAPGGQAGDRLLAPGESERLCMRVLFPTGTGLGASARGTSAVTTFTVTAEST